MLIIWKHRNFEEIKKMWFLSKILSQFNCYLKTSLLHITIQTRSLFNIGGSPKLCILFLFKQSFYNTGLTKCPIKPIMAHCFWSQYFRLYTALQEGNIVFNSVIKLLLIFIMIFIDNARSKIKSDIYPSVILSSSTVSFLTSFGL